MPFIIVFNDHHLKHARQADKRSGRQERDHHPPPAVDLPFTDPRRINPNQRFLNTAGDAPDNEDADGEQRDQFDNCL